MSSAENAEFVRNAIEQAWNTPGNHEAWAGFVTPDYVHHVFNGTTGIDGWLEGAGGLVRAFSAFYYELRTVVAENAEVAVHFTLRATAAGGPVAGKVIEATGAYFCRLSEGKIAEDWEVWMGLPLGRQFGALLAE